MTYAQRVVVVLAGAAIATTAAITQNVGKAPDLTNAFWIWSPEGGVDGSGPVCYFRLKFKLSASAEEATVLVTADNGYELQVNMQPIGAELDYSGAWRSIERFRIEQYLTKGANVITAKVDNLGGPGGFLGGVYVRLVDGTELEFVTDSHWLSAVEPSGNWMEPDHDDSLWKPARELVKHGGGPWGRLEVPPQLIDPKLLVIDRTIPGAPPPPPPDRFTDPPANYPWPAGIVYLTDRAPMNSTPAQATIWPIHGTRAFFEYDAPAPAVSGRRLYALVPARPDVKPRLLLDAGQGWISSPTCSYDGQELLFAMVPEGEKYFHIYRISADGSGLQALTEGPWHDYDPAYLPDGRIVFASTRIGSREEYHANTARSLFTLSADRREIRPLTYHIVADTEPEVTAQGRICFVRQDNFMERAKVETHIHYMNPDGTGGEVLLGQDRQRILYDRAKGAEEGANWLRELGFGCPAPLPDGRVACISHLGLTVTGAIPDGQDKRPLNCDVSPFDISPLPDGRLLATTLRGVLAIIHPDTGQAIRLLELDPPIAHSVAYLGPRPRPPIIGRHVSPEAENAPQKTGYLFCQSAFYTKQTEADWRRVKSIRVVMGEPLTLRSAQHQYGHIGTVGVELGDVPLAPDGSFFAQVPADRPLFLQAVDAEGRAVVNEMSWIYVRPGETRSCVGCHAPRRSAPSDGRAVAGLRPAVDLVPLEGAHRFRANNAANGGVLNLQFDRFREVASIDLYTPPALPAGANPTALPPGRQAEINRLRQTLQTGHTIDRRAAARRLAIFRERSCTSALATALTNEDRGVRCAAALALSACGTREAVPLLLDSLTDEAPEVAQAAHVALEHLTGQAQPFDGYGSLTERRRQATEWRSWFAAHHWEAVERELIERIGSEDLVEVQLAIEALGHIGGEAAKDALRNYAATETGGSLLARLAAIRALGHLRDEQAIPLLRQIIEANIGDVPAPPFKSHEFGWAAPPDHLAGAAAEALGRIGTPEAETVLVECFAKLREFWFYTFRTADHEWLMGCHSSIPHFRILEALEAMGSRRAREIVPQILRSVPMDADRGLLHVNDAYEVVTARLINRCGMGRAVIEACLAVLGEPTAQASEELMAAVSASPPAVSVGALEPTSRAGQILSIIALQPEEAARIRALFEHYRAQPSSRERSWVCFFLARALGKLRDRESIPILQATLAEEPPEAELGVPNPPNVFLFEVMTPMYRASAAHALGEIGATEAYPTLRAVVSDYRNAMDVRQAAAGALGRTAADVGQAKEIEELARSYPEVVTQQTLWEAWAQARQRIGTG